MGQFKPLLDLGGRTVIEHVIASFRGAGISDVRVVVGYSREKLIPLLQRLNASIVVNDHYANGMFSSVQAAVRCLEPSTGAFFLMPADVPLVREATVKCLAAACDHNYEKILVPTFRGKRGHPPLIATSLAGDIIDYSGEGGLAGIFNLHSGDILTVPVPDGNILLDMDTPGDYAYLKRKLLRLDVPTADECEVILRDIYAVPDAVIDHSRAVAGIALWICDEMDRHGFSLDRELLLSAALLHDLAKGRAAHAAESARIVRELGYGGAAALIETHMDIIPGTGREVSSAEVIYLADKLAGGDRRVTLAERFDRAMKRFGDDPETAGKIKVRYENAVGIMARIEAMTGALDFSSHLMAGAPL